MSKKTISELKEYFKATKRPTESQFADLLDSYAHLDSEIIKYLATSEYTTYLEFPPNYQVGDYIEFLAFQPDMSSSGGYYEISVAYTRAYMASAATHVAAVSHSNPNIWRECGRINRNNYIANENTNCFTIDVNGASNRFRVRATKVDGGVDGTMFMVIKVRSINKNLSWTGLNNKGNDTSTIALQPMTDEWELLVGSAFSSESAKVAIKAKSNGNVGIGTQNPDQKLTVKGKIHAEDIIINANVPADYVFEKYYDNYSSAREDYSMMNLNELESFIKENRHLPEIPSGNKMAQDGVNVGDFQMKLLQKIEELTLYTIAQHKELEQLKSQINNTNTNA
ncbi:hypothetical protein [uncultured Chryseobacterium sp.]|uniref:hypothetical protein n=1 Tax=uncultured Chryseobacterium sp. TaxID=259322 RepID=UPI0025CD5E4E|nr:hypothetical protein [uncultured Chryseobacterium sp.]